MSDSEEKLYKHRQQTTQPAIKRTDVSIPESALQLVIWGDETIVTFEAHPFRKKLFVILIRNVSFGYGMIMQIINQRLSRDILYVTARTQQLCRLVRGREIEHIVGEIFQVTVEALVDAPILSPIDCTQLYSLQRYHQFKYDEDRKLSKHRQYHLGQFPLPGWVYDMNDVAYLMNLLVRDLSTYYHVEFLSKDPVQLSYWFAQNFLVTNEERMEIMDIRTVVQRLKQELNFLKLERVLCCAMCSAEIANLNNRLPMPRNVESVYGNPLCCATVSQATNFKLMNSPHSKSSWLPKHTWRMMQCNVCGSHVGWEFLAIQQDPNRFYGLAKAGVIVKIITNETVEVL